MENDIRFKGFKEAFERYFTENSKANSQDCAGFIKTVCRDSGIVLPDNDTEGLIDLMEEKWISYDDKFAANEAAEQGMLVVVAIRAKELNSDTGHLAIMLQEKDNQNSHYLIGGSANSLLRSKGDKTLASVIQKKFQHLLRYYSPKIESVEGWTS